ncbi:hypothetical protein D0962_18870 [Leptolyngbyaceae cyanobacterium CCMR0082]|uniref:Uncharacterized protein n=1 Tax=Adonisia turfae CCMR0082 TaxID=2304604 RepID=A0A6M0S8L2_9CYAN|nr:hypothetical protein [Adonisia turfae]MDV3349954.1 hypothetical protein [Leptothoe sp. LEGE 181152]NEZ64824.1 hypothetical protein [Adonisia turfae CCMR0082]
MTHTHPPTECDRSLKEQVITDGDIANSVSWYEQNWAQISEALPVPIGGTTYSKRWQEIFDYQTLPQWRAGQLKGLAKAYVYLALGRLWRGLRERASP